MYVHDEVERSGRLESNVQTLCREEWGRLISD